MDPSQEPYDGLRAIQPHEKNSFPIISASTSAALSTLPAASDATEAHLSQPFVPGQHAVDAAQLWPTRRQPS